MHEGKGIPTITNDDLRSLDQREATEAERKRCVEIVQLARFGEIDRDWRAIVHTIETGWTIEEIKERCGQ
jgi:hypothetical protein